MDERTMSAYAQQIVPDIEGMLQRDAEAGIIDRIAYIAVGQATWDALYIAEMISADDHDTVEAGESVDVAFNVKGTARTFKVRYAPNDADGFEPRDADDNLVF